jgi:hypothetical protein
MSAARICDAMSSNLISQFGLIPIPDPPFVNSPNQILSPEHWLGVPRQWHTN